MTLEIDNLSFREFVELMQEASGDRERKVNRIKSDIHHMTRHISDMENSHDRYYSAGTGKEDHKTLSSLHNQLKKYRPDKAPSAKQRRNNAIKKVADQKKSRADHAAAQAKEKADRSRQDHIHSTATKAADEHVKNHHIPARNHGEDIFDYIKRSEPHNAAKRDAHYKKYWEVKKKLQDEHKNV